MTPSGTEPAAYRFVAQCLNQLRNCVPPVQYDNYSNITNYSTAVTIQKHGTASARFCSLKIETSAPAFKRVVHYEYLTGDKSGVHIIQGGSTMTGTDLCVNKRHCAAAVRPSESEATTSTLPPARVRTCSVLSGSC